VDENLEGHRLAGVAGARDEQVKRAELAVDDLVALHLQQRVPQRVILWEQRQQHIARTRPLQCQLHPRLIALGRGPHVANMHGLRAERARPRSRRVNLHLAFKHRIDPRPILVIVGRVDHHPVAILRQTVDPDIVDHAAVRREQEAVLRVTVFDERDIVRRDGVQEQVDVFAIEFEQAHVADVEQPGARPDGKVLLAEAAVFDRHFPPGERNHVPAVGAVPGRERSGAKRCGLAHRIGLREG